MSELENDSIIVGISEAIKYAEINFKDSKQKQDFVIEEVKSLICVDCENKSKPVKASLIGVLPIIEIMIPIIIKILNSILGKKWGEKI